MEENKTATESTISVDGQETTQPIERDEEAATVPQETADASKQSTSNREGQEPSEERAESKEEENFLTVRFNHESRGLTREQTVEFAQKGLLYDRMQSDLQKVRPVYRKLDYLASQQDTTPEALVEKLILQQEDDYKRELTERFGEKLDDETLNDLLQLFRQKQKSKYEKVEADRKRAENEGEEKTREDENRRIAREFSELQREFPEFETFKTLPESVKKQAFAGENLLVAMLKHEHEQQKKRQQAAADQKNAAKASGGSQSSRGENESSIERSFVRGLWRS